MIWCIKKEIQLQSKDYIAILHKSNFFHLCVHTEPVYTLNNIFDTEKINMINKSWMTLILLSHFILSKLFNF